MKATPAQRKKFILKLEQKTSFHIDYSDLEKLLSEIFETDVQMLESPNDSVHEAIVKTKPDAEDIEEIEEELRNGGFTIHQLTDVFYWLIYYEYVGIGSYYVTVCW